MSDTADEALVRVRGHLKSPSPVVWLFSGDSITQGAVHTRGWRDYTQLFKERLGELGRNEDVVINTAVGGWSLDGLLGRFEERIARFNPHALLLMFGTNDSAGGAGGLERFTRNYHALLHSAAQRKIDTIIQTTVPIFPLDPDRFAELRYRDPSERPGKAARLRARIEFIERYVQATVKVASQANVPLIDHWSAWMKHADTLGQLCDGGFHPNEYGHRLIAQSLFRSLGIFDETSWTCRLFLPINSI